MKRKLKRKGKSLVWVGRNGVKIILPKEYQFADKVTISGIIKRK